MEIGPATGTDELDARAESEGVTRAEWVRTALAAALRAEAGR